MLDVKKTSDKFQETSWICVFNHFVSII